MKEKRTQKRRKSDIPWKRPRTEDLHTGERTYKDRRTKERRGPRP